MAPEYNIDNTIKDFLPQHSFSSSADVATEPIDAGALARLRGHFDARESTLSPHFVCSR